MIRLSLFYFIDGYILFFISFYFLFTPFVSIIEHNLQLTFFVRLCPMQFASTYVILPRSPLQYGGVISSIPCFLIPISMFLFSFPSVICWPRQRYSLWFLLLFRLWLLEDLLSSLLLSLSWFSGLFLEMFCVILLTVL